MTPTDKREFARLMTGIAELFGKQMTPELMEIYWLACEEIPFPAFRIAATRAAKSCEFMPKPRDFLAAGLANEMTGIEAWSIVLGHFRGHRCPEHRLPALPVIEQALELIGGQRAVGQCTDAELPFMERRFREAYDEVVERLPAAERLALAAPADPQLAALPAMGHNRERLQATGSNAAPETRGGSRPLTAVIARLGAE